MKKLLLFLTITIAFCYSCNNDDDEPNVIKQEFVLEEVNNSGIKGLVSIVKSATDYTFFTIILEGTSSGNLYPTHIYNDSLTDDGNIAFSLSEAYRREGDKVAISSTPFSPIDKGDSFFVMTYDELINFDGHVKILKSESDPTVVAQGNIGINAQ
ncbi:MULTISPECIES: hypothetical protein [Aquimarina]|uniref:CHRD domain-containing protein n=1 Tax=Aquimarina algiphila TaxID=2047982 RepID=A0A554VRR8_9FLAO|nr:MULTISPECIES: hypothetical protein [Aquimarina]TSE11352.1 hypothetical protein FOF46_01600 [Aquimarina algiphila]